MLRSKSSTYPVGAIAHLTTISVVVATGLIALVDDCIKRRFHTKPRSRQVAVPLTQLKMDFVGPKVMVEHMFKRRNSGGSSKQGSPLKYASPIAAY